MDIGDGQLAVFRCKKNATGRLDFFWTERGREDKISYGQSCFGFMCEPTMGTLPPLTGSTAPFESPQEVYFNYLQLLQFRSRHMITSKNIRDLRRGRRARNELRRGCEPDCRQHAMN